MADSKARMGKSQDIQIGGADWELGEAARKLTEAISSGDALAIEAAMRDHAAAVGSKSTQMIAALFGPLMQTQQDVKAGMREIVTSTEASKNYLLTQIGSLIKDVDARLDHYGQEIDGLRADFRKSASEVAARLGKQAKDIEGLHAGQARISGEVNDIKAQLAAEHDRLDRKKLLLEEHERRLYIIEQILADRPAQRQAEHQAILDAIHQALGNGDR